MARKVTLTGMKGKVFYHGCRVRSRGGDWGEWSTSESFTVPSDPYTTELSWDHAYSYLDSLGDSRRYVFEISAFDGSSASVGSSETTLELKRRGDRDRRDEDDDGEDDDRPRRRHHRHHRDD